MSETALYRIKTVDRQGNESTLVFPVTPAPKEPSFGALATFSAERRDHMKYRASLIDDVKSIVKTGLRQPHQELDPEIIASIPGFDTATLEVLINEFSDEDGAPRLLEFLDYSANSSSIEKREIAAYFRYFRDMNYQFAEAILDRIRFETFPLFAYEDLTEMPKHETKLLGLTLGFYLHAFYRFVDPNAFDLTGSGSGTRTLRKRALNTVPALTKDFIEVLTEHPDWSRQEQIIDFAVERGLTTFDADPIRSFLTAPAQSLRDGVL